MMSLVVFMVAQAILPNMLGASPEQDTVINWATFACRLIIYLFGMGRQGYNLLRRGWLWARKELKRIFEEIDEDGNGSIDWEEFIQAMQTFKQSVEFEMRKALKILKEDEQAATNKESRTSMANKDKK